MGVRPPANDNDEPDVIEFGIPALDAKLSEGDIEYPIDNETIRAQAGHLEIPYDASGHTITVAEALEETHVASFDSEQDLLNALHPVFERKREAARTSLLAQLRSLVPF